VCVCVRECVRVCSSSGPQDPGLAVHVLRMRISIHLCICVLYERLCLCVHKMK
jgi:hypothetical protein